MYIIDWNGEYFSRVFRILYDEDKEYEIDTKKEIIRKTRKLAPMGFELVFSNIRYEQEVSHLQVVTLRFPTGFSALSWSHTLLECPELLGQVASRI